MECLRILLIFRGGGRGNDGGLVWGRRMGIDCKNIVWSEWLRLRHCWERWSDAKCKPGALGGFLQDILMPGA